MPFLERAAANFDAWMKNYDHSGCTDNEELVAFLNADRGFQYIKSYEELCQLATLVQVKGYNTSNPPCTPKEYNQAIKRANPESFAGTKPGKVVETLTSLCVDFLIKNSGIFEQQLVTLKQQEALTNYFDIVLKK